MDKDLKIGILLTIVLAMIIPGGAYLFREARCHAKYEQSYSPVTFGIVQGCMATFNGKHIPVERIREQTGG